MRRGVAAATLVAVTLLGCGNEWRPAGRGDARAIARTVEGYLTMVRTCEVSTSEAQGQLAAFVEDAIPAGADGAGVRTCDDARRWLAAYGSADLAAVGVMDYERARSSGSGRRVSRVEVSGDSARAHVGGSRKAVQLTREDGRWKIERLDFSDAPDQL